MGLNGNLAGNGERGNLLMFFYFRIKFFAGDYQPRRNESETPPPAPPKGTVAGRPTKDRAEPKLALENAAERTLEPAALQLTNFLARLYFLATRR